MSAVSVHSVTPKKQRGVSLPKKLGMRFVLIPSCLLLLFSIVVVEQQFQSTLPQREAHESLLTVPFRELRGLRRLHETSKQGSGAYKNFALPSSLQGYLNKSISSLNSNDATRCSCVDDFSSVYCCQRAIIGVYNMGLTEVDQARFQLVLHEVAAPEIMADHKYGRLFEAAFVTPLIDYRHVVVTRNWYDTIVSGYLHHKSGRDCWLDWLGNAGHRGWLLNNTRENWEHRLLNKTHLPWWPAGNGRDLCRYLSEESEEVGLRVFTAWVMTTFMDPLLSFRRRRQEAELLQGWNRTMFICYEEMLKLDSDSATNLYFWFFPNRTLTRSIRAPKYRMQILEPTSRSRLYEMVSKIDTNFYHGAIATGSAEFGCHEKA